MKSSLSLKDYEEFSAYLDGQLNPAEKARLEEKLNSDPERRAALEEIASTRALLRSAPRYRAPRNFTISAETAQKYAHRSIFQPIFAFRFSAALSALSLVVALAIQLTGSLQPALQNMAAAPAAAPRMSQNAAPAATSPAGLAAEATPPLTIQWDNTAPQASGKGGGAAPNNSIVAGGMGGGIGGGAPEGSTAPPISGSVALPPNAVSGSNDNAARPAAPAPTQAPAAQSAAPLEGSGPILGVPAQGDTGKIISPSGEFQESASVPEKHAPTASQPAPLNTRLMIEYGLLGIGVIAGIAAFFFRRRNTG